MTCELCATGGGQWLWEDGHCRVVLVNEPDYPGYCRVIWKAHVAEMTDLSAVDRAHCMHVVFAVESVLRELLAPDKINLASLGNFTPHLHWHVMPRLREDPHFPQPIWGVRQRDTPRRESAGLADRIARVLADRLNG